MDRLKSQQVADELVAKGQLQAALVEYQKLRRAFPEDQGIMNRLGDLLVQAGAHREALAIFKVLALNLQRDGYDKKAIALLRKALRLAPDDPEAVGQLSELLMASGLNKEAAKLQIDLAHTFEKQGRAQEALGALVRASSADPFDANLRFRLAQAYVGAGQKERAAGLYAEAAEELMTAGRQAEAQEALQIAMDLVKSAKLFLLQARLHHHTGQQPKAVHTLKDALKAFPGNPILQEALASAQLEAGHARQCLEALAQLRQITPRVLPLCERALQPLIRERHLPTALNLYRPIAEALAAKGGATEVCQTLLRAAEGFEHPTLLIFIGEIQSLGERKDAAIDALNHALELAAHQKTSTLRNKIRHLIDALVQAG
ncbi:MAG TPA: tetratricopeptide repeat protein [Holophagaceae bacterium]|nr:tetratricopeptide repeat protein [Holophagaceae bacterium]